jgi:hypothetical protein
MFRRSSGEGHTPNSSKRAPAIEAAQIEALKAG